MGATHRIPALRRWLHPLYTDQTGCSGTASQTTASLIIRHSSAASGGISLRGWTEATPEPAGDSWTLTGISSLSFDSRALRSGDGDRDRPPDQPGRLVLADGRVLAGPDHPGAAVVGGIAGTHEGVLLADLAGGLLADGGAVEIEEEHHDRLAIRLEPLLQDRGARGDLPRNAELVDRVDLGRLEGLPDRRNPVGDEAVAGGRDQQDGAPGGIDLGVLQVADRHRHDPGAVSANGWARRRSSAPPRGPSRPRPRRSPGRPGRPAPWRPAPRGPRGPVPCPPDRRDPTIIACGFPPASEPRISSA